MPAATAPKISPASNPATPQPSSGKNIIGFTATPLSEVLGKAAARMDTQLSRTIERVTALIQPCLLLVMAALVGGLVYTMVNIVFSTLSQLKH